MPEELVWDSFFDVAGVLERLRFGRPAGPVVEFGCGYGTFTIEAARRCSGILNTFDIEPEMVALTERKAVAAGLANVRAEVRDFIAAGTGLPDATADYCMVFNILHAERPVTLLNEVRRVLEPGGLVGIMHWNHDPSTPRGPSMAIRPKPEDCAEWAVVAGLRSVSELIDLPPYHYGFVFERAG
ncbi:MAG TPA: class I SAM-dependent methyltransferase [Pirellulales bacterium]|nr:class I SAM-dependent methyltransferase [Pirellulales bacterium]